MNKINKALAVLVLAGAFGAGANAQSLLYGSTYYQSAVASSTFENDGTYSIDKLFDNNLSTQWASWGNTQSGYNPQGNQEVWFSFNLNQSYTIDAIRVAPRQQTGAVDSISGMKVWISGTSLGVDVKTASQTSAFLSTPLGLAPTLNQLVNISDAFTPATYSLSSPVEGQYFLVQLTTNLHDISQNIGAREFVVSVPEPSSFSLLLAGSAVLMAGRRRKQD